MGVFTVWRCPWTYYNCWHCWWCWLCDCTRSVQKVHRLTRLITRYARVRYILSLFNTVSCNWNALCPVFVRSSDSAAEELFILLFQSAICRADNVFPIKIAPSHGDLYSHLIHGSLGSTESTPQMVFQSVRLSLQGLPLWQTNWPTDIPRYPICNNRPHLRSSEMQPNNKLCNIVMTDGTDQWHDIAEIYSVHLYQSTDFLNAPHKSVLSLIDLCWLQQLVCLVTVASCTNDWSPVELQPSSNASALFLVRTLIDRDEPMMISAIVLNVCRIVASDLVLGPSTLGHVALLVLAVVHLTLCCCWLNCLLVWNVGFIVLAASLCICKL